MYLLKKVFQLRDKANPDNEKPFLDHLEDLRITVTRIVITLSISTLLCYAFRNELMDVLRRPADKVWKLNEADKLPLNKISVDEWDQAKVHAEAIGFLNTEQRQAYFANFEDPGTKSRVEAACLYRAASTLPKEQQKNFVRTAPNTTESARTLTLELMEKGASPTNEGHSKLNMMGSFTPTEAFMLSMKLAFFAGIVVSFPLLLFYLLQFILPGLHAHEKRAVLPALGIGFALFLTGVLFAYFWVLPPVLKFFYTYSQEMGIQNEWRIGYYLSFATQFTLLFGLSFELPVVVMTLVKIGLLTYTTMKNTRAYAILAIAVAAAVITPTPDAFTMGLLALPMIILYEICIWLTWWDERKKRKLEIAEAEERVTRLIEEQESIPASLQPEVVAEEEIQDDGPWTVEEPRRDFDDDSTPPQDIPEEERRRGGWDA